MVCSHCGFDNPSASAYCAHCQRPLQNTAPQTTLASSQDVAKAILQRRQQQEETSVHEERTVIARAPLAPTPPVQPRPVTRDTAPQQVVQPTRAPAQPQPARVQPQAAPRPAPRPTSPFDDDAPRDEPTAVFQAPSFATPTQPARQVEPVRSAVDPARAAAAAQEAARIQARPAAAPSLPQPPSGLPGSAMREPAPPRDAASREAVARVQARNAALHAPLRTEPGVPASVLRQGATPPQRPAPRPPGAAHRSPFTPPAGWRLLLAHVVDAAVLAAVFFAFVFVDGSLSSSHVVSGSLVEWLSNHSGSAFRAALVTVLAGTTYHLMLDVSGGRTLGRIVSGTELARRSGKPLNWFVVILRTVFSYISLAIFGAGFFWAIVDRRGRCLHDLVAGTVVIRHRAT